MQVSIFTKNECNAQLLRWRKSYFFRQNLLKEWQTTENDYVVFLKFCAEFLKAMFKDLGMSQSYVGIFEGLDELYQLHNKISETFQSIQVERRQPGFIFSAYIDKYIPYFQIYHKYFNTLDKRKAVVVALQRDNKLKQYSRQLTQVVKTNKEYPPKFLQYISRIELVDYINKPFQRYHQYELFFHSYYKQLPDFNIEKDIIAMIIDSLRSGISQVNMSLDKTTQGALLQLERKHGGILKTNHTLYQSFVVGYYNEGKILEGRLSMMNSLLLLTDLTRAQKQVKRMHLTDNSWFYHLKDGNNTTNSVFVKGVNTHQIFIVFEKSRAEFVGRLQKIFDQLYFRNSWSKQIMGESSTPDHSFVFKPLSVYRQNKAYIFVVFIKVSKAAKGIRNFYSLNQLRNIVKYINQTNLSQSKPKQYMSTEELSDEEAEHIALGLFEYLIPMLKDVRVFQDYKQLQQLLKIVEYMNWMANPTDCQDDPITEWLIGSEERLRITSSCKPAYNIYVWVNSVQKAVRIGRYQRVYQVVKRIVGSGHTFDFSLSIGDSIHSSRLLDDDEIMYDCLKEVQYRFQQESNILQKGFNVIFGKSQVSVDLYLRKCLYLECHNPAMYIQASTSKLCLLSTDILDRSIPLLASLTQSNKLQLIALLYRCIMNTDTLRRIIQKVPKPEHRESFRASLVSQIDSLSGVPEIECFKLAVKKSQSLGVNTYVVDCRLNGKNCKLVIGYPFVEVKDNLISKKCVLHVGFQQLIFQPTPSVITISTPDQQYSIEVNGTYTVALVLERYIHIYNMWTKKR